LAIDGIDLSVKEIAEDLRGLASRQTSGSTCLVARCIMTFLEQQDRRCVRNIPQVHIGHDW